MLNLGQSKAAMNHYEYALNLMEREMDAKPSKKFMDLKKKIQNNSHRNTDIDLTSINMQLEDAAENGAMHCNFEYFKFLFNLQKNKSMRTNEYDYLCIINFNKSGMYNHDALANISREWVMLLATTLRNGDVFTFWNDSQILIMLHDVRGDGVSIIENRIVNNMKSYLKINENEINMLFQPLVSENTLI